MGDILGVVKVGRYIIFHHNFFCDYYALAENFILANQSSPTLTTPKYIIIQKIS